MIKTIFATSLLAIAMAAGAQAASMKPMMHMEMKPMHHMAVKCHKGMMMSHRKCMAKHKMHMKMYK